MPKNQVSDFITDQEMHFARLILSGTMTDRDAAQTAGLKPDTAAYTKAKPRVRAYMIEHRAAVEQQIVALETEQLRLRYQRREQVLDRLWQIANLSPEMTRGSVTGQVKALSLIVAMEGLIPNRRARSSEEQSTPIPDEPQIYKAAWLREQEEEEEDEPGIAAPASASDAAADAPSNSPVAERSISPETTPSAPHAHPLPYAPDTRFPFSIKQNPFKFLR